jgi:hypothetical protein
MCLLLGWVRYEDCEIYESGSQPCISYLKRINAPVLSSVTFQPPLQPPPPVFGSCPLPNGGRGVPLIHKKGGMPDPTVVARFKYWFHMLCIFMSSTSLVFLHLMCCISLFFLQI